MFTWIKKQRAGKIADKGLGPFDSTMLNSFLKGRCSHCGKDLPIFCMLGNALVVTEQRIELLCVDCRTEGKITLNYRIFTRKEMFDGAFDRETILIQLNKYIKKTKPNWIQILLALRTKHGSLQGSEIPLKAFEAKFGDTMKDWVYQNDPIYLLGEYTEPVNQKYGNLLSINSCGECGAFWGKRGTDNDEKRKEIKRSGECYNCRLPNEYQWHMRESFESELKRLDKQNLFV